MNLIQKLISIRKSIGYLKKDASGNQGANYVSPEILLGEARKYMDDLNVLLVTHVTDSEITKMANPSKAQLEKATPAHHDFVVNLTMSMQWINGDDVTDFINVSWFATGSHRTDPSMAGGGALTYFERYFILKQFNIPTGNDDPEKYVEKLEGQKLVDDTDLIKLRKALKDKNLSEKVVCHNYSDNKYTMQDISELTKNQCKESINLANNTPITNP